MCDSDWSEVPVGIPIDSRREGGLRLVLRFGTIDCVNDNLACFENGFDDSGSFLDVGGHRIYVVVTKLFPEDVTDVSDPLCDAGSSCNKSNDLGAMVEVLSLGDKEGIDLSCTVRLPLERLLPQEQAAPPPEQDTLEVAIMDLHALLDLTIDPVKATEALDAHRSPRQGGRHRR
jgi:hypothetical protein